MILSGFNWNRKHSSRIPTEVASLSGAGDGGGGSSTLWISYSRISYPQYPTPPIPYPQIRFPSDTLTLAGRDMEPDLPYPPFPKGPGTNDTLPNRWTEWQMPLKT